MKRVAIVQSSYIPWKGYFDLIAAADVFVFLDCVQYTRRDWRNRNIIKTSKGPLWLSIPVEVKGKYLQKIQETSIASENWAEKHLDSLIHHYKAARFFQEYRPFLEEIYQQAAKMQLLSEINHLFISRICQLLGIDTTLRWSKDLAPADGKTERLVDICRKLEATEYISGPSAKAYLKQELFDAHAIEVTWYDYLHYRQYEQIHPPFLHQVSVLDLILNTGHDAVNYMHLSQSAIDQGSSNESSYQSNR